jgi:TetR/AcrR family transcriptional regulator
MTMIAREAGVDPALIRYYFGDRETLLLAVVDELLLSARQPTPTGPMTAETFFNWRVMRTLSFARSARSMQRLLIDELVESAKPSIREVVMKRNASAISFYESVQKAQVTEEVADVDQLFLYIAILGMCEFFTAAQSIVRPLAGEGVDPKELSDRYGEFVVNLLLNGLLKNSPEISKSTAN